MKTIRLFILLLIPLCLSAADGRNVRIQILDKTGGLNNASGAAYYLSRTGEMKLVRDSANVTVTGVMPGDTLVFLVGERQVMIPMDDVDSLQLTLPRIAKPKDELVHNDGYMKTPTSAASTPMTSIDVSKDHRNRSATSLESYLRGRLAGVEIRNGQVKIRGGNNSIMLSSAALIVVDGMPYSSLRDVESFLRVEDIKTVTVLKDGAIYGSRGSNGVLVITTK